MSEGVSIVILLRGRPYIIVEDIPHFKVGRVQTLALGDTLAVGGHQTSLPLAPVGASVGGQVGNVAIEEVVEVVGEGWLVEGGVGRGEGCEGSGEEDGFVHGHGEDVFIKDVRRKRDDERVTEKRDDILVDAIEKLGVLIVSPSPSSAQLIYCETSSFPASRDMCPPQVIECWQNSPQVSFRRLIQ
jgi:hypothetical protein